MDPSIPPDPVDCPVVVLDCAGGGGGVGEVTPSEDSDRPPDSQRLPDCSGSVPECDRCGESGDPGSIDCQFCLYCAENWNALMPLEDRDPLPEIIVFEPY